MAAPATETFTTLIVAVVFAYAGWRAVSGALALGPFTLAPLTAGVFFAFMTSLLMAAQSLRQVANLQTVFSEGLTAARRLFEALDVAPAIVDPADAKAYRNICRTLELPDGSLPETSLDTRRLAVVKRVVAQARKVDKALHSASKKKAEKDWFVRSARELDVEVGEELVPREHEGDSRMHKKQKQEIAKEQGILKEMIKHMWRERPSKAAVFLDVADDDDDED